MDIQCRTLCEINTTRLQFTLHKSGNIGNLRLPNFNLLPVTDSISRQYIKELNFSPKDRRYNHKFHCRDYKFRVISQFHKTELCLFKKLCEHFLIHLDAVCSGDFSALNFIALKILHSQFKSPQPILLLHGCARHYTRGSKADGILYICCVIHRTQLQ